MPSPPTHRVRLTLLSGVAGSLATIAGLYLLAMAALYVWQDRLIYPAPSAHVTPATPGPGFGAIALRTSDHLTLQAAYRPARAGRRTIVFFHGNGDSMAGAAAATRPLAQAGYGLLLVEYRGYGGNPGAPDEAGLYRDGRAALRWLQSQRVSADRVVLIGTSLGSGIATQLAAEFPVAALVIVSGFTSLPDAAAANLRWAPVRSLLRDQYDNFAKMTQPEMAMPILVLHGDADTLIPVQQGRALAAASPVARFVGFPGVGHYLAYRPEAAATIDRWLATLPPPIR